MERTKPYRFVKLLIETLQGSVPVYTSFWSNLVVDVGRIGAAVRGGIRDICTEEVPVDTTGSEDRRWFLMMLLPLLCLVLVCVDQEMTPKEVFALSPAVPQEEEELPSLRMLPHDTLGAVQAQETGVYAEKDKASSQRLSLTYGDRVDPVEASAEWVQVKAGGTEGFVPRSDLVLYQKKKKYIALTYDDGPDARGTKRILDVFKKTGARGTFFVLGSRINKSTRGLVKRAAGMGCQVGNHSWNHAYLPGLSKKQIRSQLARTDRKIRKATGRKPELVRPPYGAINSKVKKVAKRPLILWSVDTEDWKYRKTKRLIKYVRKHRRNGAVILMHDIHPSTVRATEAIVKDLQSHGYELVTVSELAAIRGVKLKPGKVFLGK